MTPTEFFTLLHASGWFGSLLSRFKGDLRRWRQVAGIITLTEVAARRRRRALKALGKARAADHPGWTTTSGKGEGPGETAVLSDRTLWKRHRRYIQPITRGGGLGRLRFPNSASTAVLQRRGTGKFLIVSAAHHRAHVETVLRLWWTSGKRTPLTPAAEEWLEGIDKQARHLRRVRDEFPDAELWAPADFNVNLAAAWTRALILERYALAGHGDVRVVRTVKPTFRKRYIDGAVTTLNVGAGSRHQASASDHDAGLWRARWPDRRKKTA